MKNFYFLLFILTSAQTYAQENILAVWELNNSVEVSTLDSSLEVTNTTLNYLTSESTDLTGNDQDSTITFDVVPDSNNNGSPNAYSPLYLDGLNFTGPELHLSLAFKSWNIGTGSGTVFQIRMRNSSNTVVANFKLAEGSGGNTGKAQVSSQLYNGGNGVFKNGGHFGTNSIDYSTDVNVGLTLNFENGTYAIWTDTPANGTAGFTWSAASVTGTHDFTGYGEIDHIQINSVIGSGSYFELDQIKLSTGTYENTVAEGNLSLTDYEKSFSFYPNPAQDHLNIEKTNLSNIFYIFDTLGKNIMSIDDLSKPIDVSTLDPGLYFISDGQTTQKFIKK
jgi:hypothetical protein